MRALLCLALISAFASTAPHAIAGAATPIGLDAATDLQNDAAGHYRLENGREVRLVQMGHDLYLDLNRHYRRQLLPVGDNLLAARDGKLTVQYIQEGAVERIVIRHPELPANVRLGERSWRGL